MDFNLTREQQDIKKAAREFAVGELTEKVLEWDGNEQFPDGIRLKALELGFAGLTIPESLGGPGFGLFEECLVIEELSAISAGAARAILEPWWGTEFLGSLEKHPLLEGISEGRCQICSLSLSEPFTIDSKPLEGKFHFVLGTADIFFVPAVFKNKDGFLMIPFKTKGVTVKRLTSKLGLRAWPGADLDIKGIDVSDLDFIELNGFNIKAWQVSALRQSAMAIGIARGAVYDSLSYTRKRRIFGQALADFEATKDKFFRAWQGIEMARLMVLRAAGDWD
ncbi:MAG: acyl-CoA dehydrogenase, partial [Desulfobacteraceae bacterium]